MAMKSAAEAIKDISDYMDSDRGDRCMNITFRGSENVQYIMDACEQAGCVYSDMEDGKYTMISVSGTPSQLRALCAILKASVVA